MIRQYDQALRDQVAQGLPLKSFTQGRLGEKLCEVRYQLCGKGGQGGFAGQGIRVGGDRAQRYFVDAGEDLAGSQLAEETVRRGLLANLAGNCGGDRGNQRAVADPCLKQSLDVLRSGSEPGFDHAEDSRFIALQNRREVIREGIEGRGDYVLCGFIGGEEGGIRSDLAEEVGDQLLEAVSGNQPCEEFIRALLLARAVNASRASRSGRVAMEPDRTTRPSSGAASLSPGNSRASISSLSSPRISTRSITLLAAAGRCRARLMVCRQGALASLLSQRLERQSLGLVELYR